MESERTAPRGVRSAYWRDAWAVAAAAVLTVAIAIRLELYAYDRSFWLDESLLGLNLIEKSPGDLVRHLGYVQSAPTGFLLAQKGLLDVFGETERAMRLLPFFSSIAALFLFWLVVRRVLPNAAALLALVLFASNGTLLFQSSEAKPYSVDVAVALLLTWLALRSIDAVDAGRAVRALALFTVVGVALAWFSYPSLFVLASGIVAIFFHARSARSRQAVVGIVISAVAIGASVLVAYLVSSRSITTVRGAVFPGETNSSSRLRGTVQAAWETLSDPGGFSDKLRGLALACVLIGLFIVLVRGPLSRVVLLAGPGALAVVASFVNSYPLGGRYSLFLVPFMAIFIAAGATEIVRASSRRFLVGIPLILLLAAVPVAAALGEALHPPTRENVRPLLQDLDRSWRPGDTLYVYRNAQYALRFYGECSGCGVGPLPFPLRPAAAGAANAGFPAALASVLPSVIVGTSYDSPAEILKSLNALRGHQRLWLLFSHDVNVGPSLDEEELMLAGLDTFGRRLGSWIQPGAALYLYDTTKR